MSSSDSPAAQTTTVSNTAPWAAQQPYLTEGFERAQTDILDAPGQYYPNSTVVPFAPQTEQALGMQEQRALAGSPLTGAAQNQVQSTLQGDYLEGGNPYLSEAVASATRPIMTQFQEDVIPSIQSGFSGKGRYGSGLQARQQQRAGEDVTRQIADVAGSMAYKNYGDERSRMLQAGTLAPALAAEDYTDIGQLGNVGATREAQAGAELQEGINRFQFEQESPKDALARYMTLVGGGSYGGSTTNSSPIYRNESSDFLGQAATAAGIAGSLFGGGGIWPQ
jgi:hypothetical protein